MSFVPHPSRALLQPPPIHEAIKDRDLARAEKLLEDEAELLISVDLKNDTPLHLAAALKSQDESQDESMVRMLLQKGAKPNLVNGEGQVPLHLACEAGNLMTVLILLDPGAGTVGLPVTKERTKKREVWVNLPDINGRTPLHLACQAGSTSIVQNLLAHGAKKSSNFVDKNQRNPLHLALMYDHDQGMIRTLLENGAKESINFVDKNQRTPLHLAIRYDYDQEIVGTLLENGAEKSINFVDKNQRTPLHLACTQGYDQKVIRTLLDSGAEKSMTMLDKDQRTPLHLATAYKRNSAVEILLEYGAKDSMNLLDKDRRTALHFAAINGDTRAIQKFLENGAEGSLHSVDNDGRTALLWAIWYKHDIVAELLLDQPSVKSNLRDVHGWASMTYAIAHERRGEGFEDLRHKLLSARHPFKPQSKYRIHLKAEWEVAKAMEQYRGGTQFSSILTLSGNTIDAQAATCENYMQEHFGGASSLSVPRGLDIPFDIMVNIADVDYPFEYERGLILKGFFTLLVVTSKWIGPFESAFQWHFAHSKEKERMSLSAYTDEKYHVWDEEEKPRPQIETVRKATRTFLGWNETYRFKPSIINDTAVAVTALGRAGPRLKLKSVTPGIAFTTGKAPATATFSTTATFDVLGDSLRFPRQSKFPNTITESDRRSTILYAPDEKRGWLVPQLLVLAYMAEVYVKDRSYAPMPPKAGMNLEATRKNLSQNPEQKFFLKSKSGEINEKVEESWEEILCKLAQGLELTEEHARHQRKLFRGQTKIYGFEFFELATVQRECLIRECSIEDSHGGWVRLLDDEAVKRNMEEFLEDFFGGSKIQPLSHAMAAPPMLIAYIQWTAGFL
ncbi:MAG: hypothetical protein Q9165_001230 [Trypethelium subeluteriae]